MSCVPRAELLAMLLLSFSGFLAMAAEPAGTGDALPRPQYGAWGFDLTAADLASRPGDDFFRYGNGRWLDRVEIPADKPAYGMWAEIIDLTSQRLRGMLEKADANAGVAPVTIEEKVGAFYHSFMDEGRIEELAATPLNVLLDAVRQAGTHASIASLMGRSPADFEGTIFSISIDLGDRAYSPYLQEAGLGMPNRDYYLLPAFAAQKAKYSAYVAELLRLISWPDAEKRAAEIVAFESAIAGVTSTALEQSDRGNNRLMTVDQLESFAPGFQWHSFLAGLSLHQVERFSVPKKGAIPKIAAIYGRTPVETLRAWLAFTVADNAAPFLSRPFVQAHFEFRRRGLSGQLELDARWKRGVNVVAGGNFLSKDRNDRFGNMAWAVGELYTARWFPPTAKAEVEALITNIKTGFKARIEKIDWLPDQSSKADVIGKLDTIHPKVGGPARPRDYTKLMIRGDDLVGNIRRAAQASWAHELTRLAQQAVGPDDWPLSPQTNEACWHGPDIIFPAGVLQAPIFDPAADTAINYGAAGGLIAHELTHAVDNYVRNWRLSSNAREYASRRVELNAQFAQFEALPGSRINAVLTERENVADLGGLMVALEAYRVSLHGKPAPVLDGLTGEQRVFLGWAQMWRAKWREEFTRRSLLSDPHSPRKFRVNGVVRNIDAWYDVFDVRPGNKLYLPPEKRVHLW